MRVRSFYDDGDYIPDIVIAKASDNLDIQKIDNEDLISFCEVKYLRPHPEMLANFIGFVIELTPDLSVEPMDPQWIHPAPSLIVSGDSSPNVDSIRESMTNRYPVNFALNYENNSDGLIPSKKIPDRV